MAHSAGGWISRLYLSTAAYDGRAYNGARFVSTLVTLGSPHVRVYVCVDVHAKASAPSLYRYSYGYPPHPLMVMGLTTHINYQCQVFPPRFRGAAKVPYALRNLQVSQSFTQIADPSYHAHNNQPTNQRTNQTAMHPPPPPYT